MNKPEVTRQDVRRIITEYLAAHPPDDEDELIRFTEKRNVDSEVWSEVINTATTSGIVFFSLLMAKKGEEAILGNEGFAMVEQEEIEAVVGEVCGSVAATFFMLGWEVSEQVR